METLLLEARARINLALMLLDSARLKARNDDETALIQQALESLEACEEEVAGLWEEMDRGE